MKERDERMLGPNNRGIEEEINISKKQILERAKDTRLKEKWCNVKEKMKQTLGSLAMES